MYVSSGAGVKVVFLILILGISILSTGCISGGRSDSAAQAGRLDVPDEISGCIQTLSRCCTPRMILKKATMLDLFHVFEYQVLASNPTFEDDPWMIMKPAALDSLYPYQISWVEENVTPIQFAMFICDKAGLQLGIATGPIIIFGKPEKSPSGMKVYWIDSLDDNGEVVWANGHGCVK